MRLEFKNKTSTATGRACGPGMYGTVYLDLPTTTGLMVPAEAVVDTGETHYLFVAKEGGRFEPRTVKIGARLEDQVEILSGVAEGETVVTTGNFLIDSESRLRAAIEGQTSGTPGAAASAGTVDAEVPDKTACAPARSAPRDGAMERTARPVRSPGAEENVMVEKIIEFCARNRLVVLLGVGFALVAAHRVDQEGEAGRHPGSVRPAGHRLHRVDGAQPDAGRGPGHLPDRVEADRHAARHRRARLLDVRDVVRVRHLRGGDRHLLGAQPRARVHERPARRRCPRASTPTLGPDATGIGWVFQYALTDKSGKHGLDELRTFQDFTLRYALGSVPGVAEVASVGGYQKQYQVTVDPNRLRAYGVTLTEVIDAIRQSNNDVGGRIIEFSGREYYVRGRGYIHDLGAIEKIALRASGPSGTPLLVKDVGHGALRPRHSPRAARMERRGRGRRRRSWSCATARTRSTSSSA